MYRIPIYTVTLVRERTQAVDKKRISSPTDAYKILNEFIGDTDREHFIVLLMDARNTVRGIHIASIGSLNAAIVHPREVFKSAILANSAGVILCHTHPSGDTAPSSEDLALTSKLVKAGELLGIAVFDHIILGDNCFLSLKERGLI